MWGNISQALAVMETAGLLDPELLKGGNVSSSVIALNYSSWGDLFL